MNIGEWFWGIYYHYKIYKDHKVRMNSLIDFFWCSNIRLGTAHGDKEQQSNNHF